MLPCSKFGGAEKAELSVKWPFSLPVSLTCLLCSSRVVLSVRCAGPRGSAVFKRMVPLAPLLLARCDAAMRVSTPCSYRNCSQTNLQRTGCYLAVFYLGYCHREVKIFLELIWLQPRHFSSWQCFLYGCSTIYQPDLQA